MVQFFKSPPSNKSPGVINELRCRHAFTYKIIYFLTCWSKISTVAVRNHSIGQLIHVFDCKTDINHVENMIWKNIFVKISAMEALKRIAQSRNDERKFKSPPRICPPSNKSPGSKGIEFLCPPGTPSRKYGKPNPKNKNKVD